MLFYSIIKEMTIQIYNNDCLEEIQNIKEKVSLVLVDLPYGQTNCAWDSIIDLKQMWIELKKVCKQKCIYVFFCTTKFGYKLIQSNESWFRYDLVWEKSRKVGFLSANKQPLRNHEMVYVFKEKQGTYNPQKTEGKPYKFGSRVIKTDSTYGKKYNPVIENKTGLRHPTSILYIPETPEDQEPRQHEMVYVFSNPTTDDLENNRNLELREYAKLVKKHINKPIKEIDKQVGNQGIHNFYKFNSQFSLPTEQTYKKLIDIYSIDKMKGYRTFEDLAKSWEKDKVVYNAQKTEGTPYKTTSKNEKIEMYNNRPRISSDNKTGLRHPSSILYIPETPEDQEPRQHEMVYVFSNPTTDDLENNRNLELREYAKLVKKHINKPMKEINKQLGNQGIDHFFRFTSTQFGIPTEQAYKKLIDIYSIDKMKGYRTFEDLAKDWGKNGNIAVYNAQKTEGNPYKVKGHKTKKDVYGQEEVPSYENKTGQRHPLSILNIPQTPETTIVKFNNPVKSLHPTQKPTDLCEWLIKSYSNEGDLVLDFCMGSASTGIACINTKRNFIGIEKDDDIFKTARNRLIQHELNNISMLTK